MRTIKAGAAISLDGFIADPDGGFDWLLPPTKEHGLAEQWAAADTMLVGRKTWEVMQGMAPKRKTKKPSSKKKSGSTPPRLKNYVFSRTRHDPEEGFEWVSDDPAGFVRRLKQADGKDILVMGGGIFMSWLLEEGFVDEILVNVQPIVLGRGIPLFDGTNSRIRLERLKAQAFSDGTVGIDYRVIPREAVLPRRASRARSR